MHITLWQADAQAADIVAAYENVRKQNSENDWYMPTTLRVLMLIGFWSAIPKILRITSLSSLAPELVRYSWISLRYV